MTFLTFIETQAQRLQIANVSYGHGTLNAFDETCWLALWCLGLPLDDLEAIQTLELSSEQEQKIHELITKRIDTREPAAYLTGEAWLQGIPFSVDKRCIIPRSLIAEPIVDGTLDAWLSANTQRVLDLCTGNGSLAVLAAMAWPDVSVDAADISSSALEVALLNIQKHQLTHRIKLYQGDGLDAVTGQSYDLILCNPPYVNAQAMSVLPPEYQAEPALALAGGMDGMDFIRPLLSKVGQFLRPDGVLVLEIGHEMPYFEGAFPQLEIITLPTSAGDEHVVLLTREAILRLDS
jgi:ribosomal protein L3 glutamine methyltransferase